MRSFLQILVLLASGDALLLAPAGSPLRVVGALIILALPGLVWARRLAPPLDYLTRWLVGAGLSYTLAIMLGLGLHYLPGPIPLWATLAALNVLAVLPGLLPAGARGATRQLPDKRLGWLAVIFLLAALFRFTNLGYSEFQGDEALAMITAAEALEGHQDALFLRGKGPGEALLPLALWRLTGTINETIARLPFAIAGLLMVLTTYRLGCRLLSGGSEPAGQRAGLLAAGLLALNGFMVAFSRIVQYQALVVWMSGLALLCAWEWRAGRRTNPSIWAALSGAFLGTGLLSHYDAILVAPTIVYLQLAHRRPSPPQPSTSTPTSTSTLNLQTPNLLLAVGGLLIVAGPFYIPYALDPQASRTGAYLGDRIGDTLLKNNLADFLHFNIFYNSSYYVILTGLLALGYLAWALRNAPVVQRLPGGRGWVPALAVLIGLGLMIWPNLLQVGELDLAVLPFSLMLLAVFLSSALDAGQRAVVAWLAVPFLGYNFAVALPLTHIYTVVPAWTLLAGLAAAQISDFHSSPPPYRLSLLPRRRRDSAAPYSLLLAICGLFIVALFSGYLYIAFLRQAPEFWQDWPESQSPLYWSPYEELPPAGFFGFVHKAGWKAVGELYARGRLVGDYGSNEEPEVTTWYTRGTARACDPRPEYYFIADDVVDIWPVDSEEIQTNYVTIGRVFLPNGKGTTLYQARPARDEVGQLQADNLADAFDHTATPAAFARSARGSQPIGVDLGGLVRLIGYNVDTRRAWPGGRVPVTLYWQALAPIPHDYHVFVHLEGDPESGSAAGIWGQADGRPVCWSFPTLDWRPGQVIADQHAIAIQPDTPAGEYLILVGMYRPDTGTRLDVLDEAGNPVANFIELRTVSIR
ncbi:MAG: hypothetical protein Kow0063_37520 [Anaerolineae bacterium]